MVLALSEPLPGKLAVESLRLELLFSWLRDNGIALLTVFFTLARLHLLELGNDSLPDTGPIEPGPLDETEDLAELGL